MYVVSFYTRRKERTLNIVSYKDEFDFKHITCQSRLESKSFKESFCNLFRQKLCLAFEPYHDIFIKNV